MQLCDRPPFLTQHTHRRNQICHEFERFSAYLPDLNVMVIYGGVDAKAQKEQLKAKPPHIVVGTPGRIKQARALLRRRRNGWHAGAAMLVGPDTPYPLVLCSSPRTVT